MAINAPKHEIYTRRKSRNLAVMGCCIGMAVMVFAVTIVKVQNGGMVEGFDHTYRASVLPITEPVE